MHDHVFAEQIASLHSARSPGAEEQERLKQAVAMLQAQLSLERRRRAAVEEDCALALAENRELERRLGAAGACRARALELEAEVAELRQMLQAEPPGANGAEELAPDSLFAPFQGPSPSLLQEVLLAAPEAPRRPLKRSSSETVLSSLAGGDVVTGHEETCIRRAQAVRRRGVSLLQEVDTQYSALKVKYEELLRRCQREEDALSHKAVQTARAPAAPEPAGSPASTPPPEYKALFQEIFSCIRKTQQEIDEQRARGRSRPSQASPGLQPSA